jgi:uncharacterized Zn-binding protein involved in type VI secretion
MGMIAAKHTDPIVGMDMHMIQPPPPAAPVMVPHPVAGMIMDPSDYSGGACTVYINGLPRARAGSMCMMSPPHIPIGGVFVMPVLSEAEVAQGSSTVIVDGEAMSASNHQVLSCDDTGAPAPVRPWKSGGAKSLMKAGSVVLAIPAGAPVMVGGSPTTAASGKAEAGLEVEEGVRQVRFAIRYLSDGVPRRLVPCSVKVDGAERGDISSTDAVGRVEVSVPLDAVSLDVVLHPGTKQEQVHKYDLHRLDPAVSEGGAKQRLWQLGFLGTAPDEATAEALTLAAYAFQVTFNVPATAQLDDVTRARLAEVYGS